MARELTLRGIGYRQQAEIDVFYKNCIIGRCYADFVVEEKVIVEVKRETEVLGKHEGQILNYLNCTQLQVGLLISFGPTGCSYRRFVT